MIQKIVRAMIGIFGFVLGFTIYSSLASTFPVLLFGIEKGTILISAVVGLIIGVIFYIIGPWVIDRFKYIAKLMDKEISKYPQTGYIIRFYRSYNRVRYSLFIRWFNKFNTYSRRNFNIYYIWIFGIFRYKNSFKE